MSALYNPSTWLIFAGAFLLAVGFVLMSTTWRNRDRMPEWKKEIHDIRSRRGAYTFGVGAVIAVSGGFLLIMSLPWVLVLAGSAFLVWGISLQNERHRRCEAVRGHAGYILISIGILVIVFAIGLFLLF